MAEAVDLGERDAPGPDRGRFLSELDAWVERTFGHSPRDPALFRRAVTHGSLGEASYERLEFLGDRVLGLVMAEWLFERFPAETEGVLSRRLHLLVSGPVCAQVARAIGVAEHLRLNKQAYDDGARDSDNVLGDVVESLLGALFLEAGMEPARRWVRERWADRIDRNDTADKHPKAALQDWALANKRGMPSYALTDESGPGHARRHTVVVRLGEREASATGSTKREAETEAARALLAAILTDVPVKRRKRATRPGTLVSGRG